MTISEYAELAQRTASTKTKSQKIGHGCLGLIGEAGEVVDILKKERYMSMPYELAREKLIDECGDLVWYSVELCTGLGMEFEEVYNQANIYDKICDTSIGAMMNVLLIVVDAYQFDSIAKAKRRLGFYTVSEILANIIFLLNNYHITFEEVINFNIDKLSKRYPEHIFNADRSNERYAQK